MAIHIPFVPVALVLGTAAACVASKIIRDRGPVGPMPPPAHHGAGALYNYHGYYNPIWPERVYRNGWEGVYRGEYWG